MGKVDQLPNHNKYNNAQSLWIFYSSRSCDIYMHAAVNQVITGSDIDLSPFLGAKPLSEAMFVCY